MTTGMQTSDQDNNKKCVCVCVWGGGGGGGGGAGVIILKRQKPQDLAKVQRNNLTFPTSRVAT